MDPETKQAAYHSAPYHAAGTAIMSFEPINTIHQHLCAFHVYSHDRSRHVEAHHYCQYLSADLHQCIIYDSDKADSRLIGIEYIVSEKVFKSLPQDEKKYWHSHKYEVESGLLQLATKSLVPASATGVAEQPAMLELQKTYGKTIHTWAIDTSPELPSGPPEEMIKKRDAEWGQDTVAKGESRKEYLPQYEKVDGADEWESTGRGIKFVVEEVTVNSRPANGSCVALRRT